MVFSFLQVSLKFYFKQSAVTLDLLVGKILFNLIFVRRILIFPKGNNVDHLSIYLDVADSATLPYGWSRYAQFSLTVINQMHNKFSIRKGISCLNFLRSTFLLPILFHMLHFDAINDFSFSHLRIY